jgi:hypothetical protein
MLRVYCSRPRVVYRGCDCAFLSKAGRVDTSCLADERVPSSMSRVYTECPDSADVLLRQEPDEEEDEQEDGCNDKEGDGDDEETNEGYSERQLSVRWRPRRVLKLIKAPALLHWSLSL